MLLKNPEKKKKSSCFFFDKQKRKNESCFFYQKILFLFWWAKKKKESCFYYQLPIVAMVTYAALYDVHFCHQDIDLEALRILEVCYERAKEVYYITQKKHVIATFCILPPYKSIFPFSDPEAESKTHGCCGWWTCPEEKSDQARIFSPSWGAWLS